MFSHAYLSCFDLFFLQHYFSSLLAFHEFSKPRFFLLHYYFWVFFSQDYLTKLPLWASLMQNLMLKQRVNLVLFESTCTYGCEWINSTQLQEYTAKSVSRWFIWEDDQTASFRFLHLKFFQRNSESVLFFWLIDAFFGLIYFIYPW